MARGLSTMQSGMSQTGNSKRPAQALFPAAATKPAGRRKPVVGPQHPRSPQYSKGQASKITSKRQKGQKKPPSSSSPKTGINKSLRGLNF